MRTNRNNDICGMMVLSVLFIAVLFMQGGCSNTQKGSSTDSSTTPPGGATPTATPNTTPTPTATPTPTPTPTPASTGIQYMSVKAVFPSFVYAPFHVVNQSDATDWSDPACRVDVTLTNPGPTNKTVYCQVEIGELDLWTQGFQFNWEAPVANCPYLYEKPYWFNQFKPGDGPSDISYTMNTDTGKVSNLVINTTTDGNARVITGKDGTEAVVCDYDYSQDVPLAGPNCCMGYYSATVTTVANGQSSTNTSRMAWGGKYGNCAAGPMALDDRFPRDKVYNFPLPLITAATGGLTGSTKVNSPQSRLEHTNISSANYTATTTPFAAPLTSVSQLYNPYYEYICVDASFAVMGRILVTVRKWNLQSELVKGGTGDPTKTSTINGYPAPYGDRWSWDELISNGNFKPWPQTDL